jgi:methylaspartate mutase epsilon subunit
MLNMVSDQKFPPCAAVEQEVELIKSEVRAVLKKVFELGNGDVARGTVLAFEAGVLDVPLLPPPATRAKFCRFVTTPAPFACLKPARFRCRKISSPCTTITSPSARILKDANPHSRWLLMTSTRYPTVN